MKPLVYLAFIIAALLLNNTSTDAQILKKIKNRAAQTAENKVLNKTEEVTNKTMDEADKNKKTNSDNSSENNNEENDVVQEKDAGSEPSKNKPGEPSLLSFSNYDFVPGDKIIYYYDMAGERDAEIPGRMLINDGNVEVQSHNGQKVLFIPKESSLSMVPMMKTNNYLPEQFTLEFEALSNGDSYESIELYFRKPEYASARWNGNCNYYIRLGDISSAKATAEFTINLSEGGNAGGYRKFADEAINQKKDNWRKIALYVNKNIGKLYVDQHRVAVVNRIEPGAGIVTFEFRNDGGPILIKNIRIAAGGADAYNKVVTDGKFIAYGIQFDVNKSTIKPESMGTLNEIVKMMKQNNELKFEIGGHTDSDGTAERNNQLSQERAEAVKKQLENMGIAGDRLSAKGYGSSKPLSDNSNAENKAKNRRVEFVKN